VMLIGGEGTVYIDNVSFEVTGEVKPAPIAERSRPLTGRGLENLVAFARLYGYIRHFHPSDEAAAADWNALAIAGVPAVENASDPADLARKLAGFFRAVAPAVQVGQALSPVPSGGQAGATMISWKHHGFGSGAAQSIYRSERVTAPVPEGGLPRPFLADLGGGVKALVPVALVTAGAVTPPPAHRNIRYTANDRATRIAGVIIAWNIFQHFYPYFDVVQTDWGKALETALQSAAADRDERDFVLTLRRLVAALKDGHGSVIPGPQGAPAPLAWDWIENRLVVTFVPDAQGQAIERGDAVLGVNGKPVAQALAEIEALTSGATPQWIRWKALRELGLGALGRPLVLEIEPFRDPAHRRTVTLKRGSNGGASDPRPDKIAELKPGVFYVDLTRISDSDWSGALPRLQNASGIVFDLRGYPTLGPNWLTYLSDQRLHSQQWHVPEVTAPDHKNLVFSRAGDWDLAPSKPYLKARRAVLTNGSAISYAESTMGIIEHYKLAEIVGSPTAGTNGNVNPIALPGGYTLTWTGMKVLKHDGSQHHGIGIKPTVPVSRTRAGVAAGRDEVLERGLEAVQ
jgi:C-terminal processing protease CtpA/Prc